MISGISDRFVSPMLLCERALTIIATTTATHIMAITVIETAVVVAVVMEFTVGIMVFVVVVLVAVAAVLVMVAAVVADVMVLAVVAIAAVVVFAAAVVHTVDDIDPGEPVNMPSFFAFEFTQKTPQSICSKDVA